MIKVIDDFIPKDKQDELERFVTTNKFPWFFVNTSTWDDTQVQEYTEIPSLSALNKLEGFVDPPMFNHTIFSGCDTVASHVYPTFENILLQSTALEQCEFSRIRINFSFPYLGVKENSKTSPHIDNLHTPFTAIYYVNDSDGDTILYNETLDYGDTTTIIKNVTVKQKVTPKKGRMLIFDSNRLHSAGCPWNSDKRIVVNFNFRNKNV